MRLSDYTIGDEEKILQLFKAAFGKDMSPAYWKWRFQDNPAGKHMIKLMWDEDKLVGHYAVSPVLLNLNKKKVLTSLSMTTMTHPEYGGRGIFGELATALYKDLEEKYQVKAVWGFPNNNSHYAFVQKLGWKNIGLAHTIVCSGEKISRPENVPVNVLDDFTLRHAEILQTEVGKFDISVDRSIDYLRWRYLQNPSHKYKIFEVKGEEGNALAVAKKYVDPTGKMSVNIMEIGGTTSPKLLGQLIGAISHHFSGSPLDCTMWLSLFDRRYALFEKLGFIPSGQTTYLGFYSNFDVAGTMADFRNWYYSFGDSDVY
ncbi:GNAT family N-acetyltransferase [Imperialibacter roseus]|uniref:GNAT family N-acetyltransferase n=1 Tax=Imperialibacter roseus TaxID=1324217 RepID=A0ABZ0IP64_9BACT|nr:GNAT family N-acetyltransferase [Imperialibacter roseus]WOK05362.1 GNAT family N-acetyltransferase [Imperialibacter roseus]